MRSLPRPFRVVALACALSAGGNPWLAVSARAQAADEVLARARDYVATYERAFVNLLAEERSTQELREPGVLSGMPGQTRGGAGMSGGGMPMMEQPASSERTTRRRLRANYLVIRADTGLGWVPFRDVVEVDGKGVGEREQRLVELLSGDGPADLARARNLMVEGARHDLGEVARTFNIPVLGLLFLHPDRAEATTFTRRGQERVAGRRALVYAFEEPGRPSLVRGPGDQDLPSSGRVWVDETSGTILKTEHIVQAWDVTAVVTVQYRQDNRLDMWLPERMDEEYRWSSNKGRTLRVSARYSDYRRLQVDASEDLNVPRKPPGR